MSTDLKRDEIVNHLMNHPRVWIQSDSLCDCFQVDQSQLDRLGALTKQHPNIHRKTMPAAINHHHESGKSVARLHYRYDEANCVELGCDCG